MKSSQVLTYMRQTIDAKGFTEGPFGLRKLEGLQETSAPEVVSGRIKKVEFMLEAIS